MAVASVAASTAARPSQVVVPDSAPHPPPLVEPIPEVGLPVMEVVEIADGTPLQVRDHAEAASSDDIVAGSHEVEEVTDYAYEGHPYVEEDLEEEGPDQLKLDDDELPPQAPDDEELSPEVARPPTVPLAVEEVDDAFDDWLR